MKEIDESRLTCVCSVALGNHCIRAVDLESGRVFLLAGKPEVPGESRYDAYNRGCTDCFLSPKGIAVKSSSNGKNYTIFVTDSSFEENPIYDESGNYNGEIKREYFILRISIPNDGIGRDWSSMSVSYLQLDSAGNHHLPCDPSGLALTPDGESAILACPEENSIYKYETSTGAVHIFAGSIEPGYLDAFWTSARFRFPQGVAVSPDGKWALIAE